MGWDRSGTDLSDPRCPLGHIMRSPGSARLRRIVSEARAPRRRGQRSEGVEELQAGRGVADLGDDGEERRSTQSAQEVQHRGCRRPRPRSPPPPRPGRDDPRRPRTRLAVEHRLHRRPLLPEVAGQEARQHLHDGAAARAEVAPDLDRRLADHRARPGPVRVHLPVAALAGPRPVPVRRDEALRVLAAIADVAGDHRAALHPRHVARAQVEWASRLDRFAGWSRLDLLFVHTDGVQPIPPPSPLTGPAAAGLLLGPYGVL